MTLLLPLLAAASIAVECPAEFSASAIKFNQAAPGWTPYAPSALHVSSGDVMYGPPASHLLAKPTIYRQHKDRDVATWDLKDQSTTPKWLTCGYGAAGEVTLSRQLPSDLKECTVTAHKDQGGNISRVVATCSTL